MLLPQVHAIRDTYISLAERNTYIEFITKTKFTTDLTTNIEFSIEFTAELIPI